MKLRTNIVPTETLRSVQADAISIISDAVCHSFGPSGSTTMFIKTNKEGNFLENGYTKDGFTIIKNIRFMDYISGAVVNNLIDSARYIVKTVGDGTSSVAIISAEVFKALCNDYSNDPDPANVIYKISQTIEEIQSRILDKGRECTLDDIYDIALIATNNNGAIANDIYQIYRNYGMDVFIDIGTSTTESNIIKAYDGLILDGTIPNVCFITDSSKGICELRDPNIYCFWDPIDTPEQLTFLNQIITDNIIDPIRNQNYKYTPTVILCPYISPDLDGYFSNITDAMNQFHAPLCIFSGVEMGETYEDICTLCGAKFIKKYINPDIQQTEIEQGLAPVPETIHNFAGYCDSFIADTEHARFINPDAMFNGDGSGSKSELYLGMISYIEKRLAKAKEDGEKIGTIYGLKRRLYSLKGNMIEYLIGGISDQDRGNLKSSVEDAVLNCRSAATDGVGYGANYMALSVLYEMKNETKDNVDANKYVDLLYNAYTTLFAKLYRKDEAEMKMIINESLMRGCPLNIRTNEYDGKVLSSIQSDVVILEAINKIIVMMYSCNQAQVPDPTCNVYVN